MATGGAGGARGGSPRPPSATSGTTESETQGSEAESTRPRGDWPRTGSRRGNSRMRGGDRRRGAPHHRPPGLSFADATNPKQSGAVQPWPLPGLSKPEMSQRSLRPAGSPWFAEAAGVRTNEWSSREGARGREDQAPRGAPGGATPAAGAVEEAKRHLGSGHWQVSAELVPPTVQGAASPHGAASGPLRSLAGCRWHRAGDSLLAGTLRAELFSS